MNYLVSGNLWLEKRGRYWASFHKSVNCLIYGNLCLKDRIVIVAILTYTYFARRLEKRGRYWATFHKIISKVSFAKLAYITIRSCNIQWQWGDRLWEYLMKISCPFSFAASTPKAYLVSFRTEIIFLRDFYFLLLFLILDFSAKSIINYKLSQTRFKFFPLQDLNTLHHLALKLLVQHQARVYQFIDQYLYKLLNYLQEIYVAIF